MTTRRALFAGVALALASLAASLIPFIQPDEASAKRRRRRRKYY